MFWVRAFGCALRLTYKCDKSMTAGAIVGMGPDGSAVPAGGEVRPLGVAYQITTEWDGLRAWVAMGRGLYCTETWIEDCRHPVVPGDSLYVADGILTQQATGLPVAVVMERRDNCLEYMMVA